VPALSSNERKKDRAGLVKGARWVVRDATPQQKQSLEYGQHRGGCPPNGARAVLAVEKNDEFAVIDWKAKSNSSWVRQAGLAYGGK